MDRAVAKMRNSREEIKEAPREYIPEIRLKARNISNIGRLKAIRFMVKSGSN
jgi:hypothetical protein